MKELLTLELKARRDTLDDLFEILTEEQFDIAEKAIDKYIDYLEQYESVIIGL